jgi:hypothetical protein
MEEIPYTNDTASKSWARVEIICDMLIPITTTKS